VRLGSGSYLAMDYDDGERNLAAEFPPDRSRSPAGSQIIG
jgi:hypothetical protein